MGLGGDFGALSMAQVYNAGLGISPRRTFEA
jgi:hypothetical protein